MRLIERMNPDFGPPQCLMCGKGNTPNNKQDGSIGPFLDLEREVNWGDPAYLCIDCGTRIGAIFGMATADDLKDRDSEIKAKDRLIHDLEAKLEMKNRRVKAAESKLDTVTSAKKIVRKAREKAA